MAAKPEKTSVPGVYRRGGRYAVAYRDATGRQRWESARTLDEARPDEVRCSARPIRGRSCAGSRAPACRTRRATRRCRGQGTGKRGFREETRAEYRASLDRYALEHFSARVKLGDVNPRAVAEFVGWLVKQPNGRGGSLSDKSVRNALGPLSACLATAKREGLVRHNPCDGAALPHRPRVEQDDDRPRPFPRIDGTETMELVVQLVHPKHRLMFELLAATGVRRSELIAFEGRHLALDGDRPHVKVRQRAVRRKGEGMVVGPLKSRHASRDLPIPLALADRLKALGTTAAALVFESPAGGPYDPHHLQLRVLDPACSEAGVEWAAFHTFRHTVASRMFAAGRNAVQVQRWLGHHSPSFTIDTYVHLLNNDLGDPLEAAHGGGIPVAGGANKVQTRPTENGRIQPEAVFAETAA